MISNEVIAEIECVRVVAMVTNFWTEVARPITGFVRMIAIGSWLWRGV